MAALNRPEHTLKVLVVGDVMTGKTSLIQRCCFNDFSRDYRATVGVDFASRKLQIGESWIEAQLWDIAGQERYSAMTHVYYKGAHGVLIVFDVTSPASFEGVAKWKQDIDSKIRMPDGRTIPVVLCANKYDLCPEDTPFTEKMLEDYVSREGFLGWAYTSAKTGEGVSESVRTLSADIVQKLNAIPALAPAAAISLTKKPEEKSSSCC